MVLEALLNPIKAERKPWETFFMGVIYSSLAVIISLLLFKQVASTFIVALTAMSSIPLIYGAIKLEEKKDMEIMDESTLMKEHGKALMVFIFLFLGFLLSFMIWNLALPVESSQLVFKTQIDTIQQINNSVTGNMINILGTFKHIFLNNIRVLMFCLLFAFFYGFGAIFVLTWNATILATLVGSLIKTSTSSYIVVAPQILLKYTLHGIPEMAAYFFAGMAGGIISIAIIRHDFHSPKFRNVVLDSINLLVLSVVVLVIAALIEIFISPLIF